MTCALCGADAVLRDSHIIPEFLHRPVYDSKHRALSIGMEAPTRVLQKGLRDRLLCDDCERRLQKSEHYFARLWYKDRCIPEMKDDLPLYFDLRGLDYRLFKLFVLSVVWRAGVSQRPEFAQVSLGPHGEPIRRMLLDGDAGTAREYPIIGGLIVGPDGAPWDDVLMAPMRIRVARHNAVRMVLAGVSWTILTSSHPAPTLDPLCLQEDGTMVMAVADWESHSDVAGIASVAHAVSVPDLR